MNHARLPTLSQEPTLEEQKASIECYKAAIKHLNDCPGLQQIILRRLNKLEQDVERATRPSEATESI